MRVGGYEVLGELGRGGMGVVFRVRSPTGPEAALKLIVKTDAATFARFDRERRLLGSLGEEQGFVGLLDAGQSSEGAWLVMPLVPGGTLRRRLGQGFLGVEETIALGTELASALGTAHALGIVHRDVKPENVLFTASGRALLADLGLAKHFDPLARGASQSVRLTGPGVFKGTAGYTAPEQVQEARSAGPPCDVFALGAVLYECLSGRPAFPGESVIEVLTRVSSGTVEPLGRPEVPAWLEKVVAKALAPDPRERFADGVSLARALRERGSKKAESPRKRWALLLLALAALGIAAGVAIGLGLSSPRPEKGPHPPAGLRLAPGPVPAADGKDVPLYLLRLPDGLDMEMVALPAGDFLMGADDAEAYDREKPKHRHALDQACWIGRTDVTWAQFRAFCRATGRAEPEKPPWWSSIPGTKDDHPVVQVSWQDARDYGRWAGGLLPTEAEWEKAARGTDGRKWPWGNEWDPGARCNFADASCPLDVLDAGGGKKLVDLFHRAKMDWDKEHSDGFAYTSPAGHFLAGASPCGALDMAGNVGQWCDDAFEERAYERYVRGDRLPPLGDRTERVQRGGCWYVPARMCRSAFRASGAPDHGNNGVGFRIVLR